MSETDYLYIAYAVMWLLLFLYISKLMWDIRKTRNDVRLLREVLDGKEGEEDN